MSLCSASQLSELTGKDRRTIKKLLSDVVPIQEGRSHLYESTEVLPLIFCPQTDDSDSDYLDLNLERARLAKAQTEAQELKNAITRREQAPVWLLTAAISRVSAQIASILGSTPLNLKRNFPDMSNALLAGVEAEIAKARNAAAGIRLDLDDTDE